MLPTNGGSGGLKTLGTQLVLQFGEVNGTSWIWFRERGTRESSEHD